MRYIILFILFTNFCFSQEQGTVLIDSDENSTGLIITKDPTGQTMYSPALLIQDKPNTIYPPTRNDGILFEVRGNNSPPVGRPLFSVQGEGAVRMWDYCTILPSLIPIQQWFPEPSILQVGSDLSGTPGAVNIVVQNQRSSEPGAQGGHPFMKFVDMNTGEAGIVPGESRLYITGGGSLKYGDDNSNSPNLVPFWPGDAYVIDGPKQPNFAVRNAIGQRGTEYGGLYSKFNAVKNDLFYINNDGSLSPFINRDSTEGSITINNEKKFQIFDGLKIGLKTGNDGTFESDYGGINFLNTKIGYNINPTFTLDINSSLLNTMRIKSNSSQLELTDQLIFESSGTMFSINGIDSISNSSLNLWSTTEESNNQGPSILFGSKNKSGTMYDTYAYGQIICGKSGSNNDFKGSMKFITVAEDGSSNERITVEESGIDLNGILNITKTHPIDGSGVKNGSIFKGSNGALYYKSDLGTVTMIAPN